MITYESLRRFATTLDGQALYTLARKTPFTFNLLDNGFEYIPKSTNKPRPDPISVIHGVLERYNQTRSLRPTDYLEISANASYLLRLIELYELHEPVKG